MNQNTQLYVIIGSTILLIIILILLIVYASKAKPVVPPLYLNLQPLADKIFSLQKQYKQFSQTKEDCETTVSTLLTTLGKLQGEIDGQVTAINGGNEKYSNLLIIKIQHYQEFLSQFEDNVLLSFASLGFIPLTCNTECTDEQVVADYEASINSLKTAMLAFLAILEKLLTDLQNVIVGCESYLAILLRFQTEMNKIKTTNTATIAAIKVKFDAQINTALETVQIMGDVDTAGKSSFAMAASINEWIRNHAGNDTAFNTILTEVGGQATLVIANEFENMMSHEQFSTDLNNHKLPTLASGASRVPDNLPIRPELPYY